MSRFPPLPKKLEEDLSNIPRYKPEPFKIDKILNTSIENALFDDVFGSLVKPNSNRSSSSNKQQDSECPSKPPSDFTTLLASKLADTENENKTLRNKLATSALKISRLEETVQELSDVIGNRNSSNKNIDMDAVQRIRSDNTRLQRQLMEMEQYLADYGMHWVGYSDQAADNDEEDRRQEGGEYTLTAEMIDFDLFIKKVKDLNSLIQEEPTQIITEHSGSRVKARLAHASEIVESVKVAMYKNGLMIKRGPFRPAGSESFNSFLGDIMDGYYPTEFRDACPDGFLIDLIDKRDEIFRDDKSTESSYRQNEMKAAQLIERLPKTVIRGGDILSVRGGVSSVLTGSAVEELSGKDNASNKQIVQQGKKICHLSTRAKLSIEKGDKLNDDDVITSIQVKWHNGSDVFILKMFGSDLVQDVKTAIESHIVSSSGSGGQGGAGPFKLRCAYPPRDLQDGSTLFESGLVPSATLHAQLI